MILSHVTYELLPFEELYFAADEASGWHQLDGQVRLDMADGTSQFVSWGNEPLQYSIEVRSESFFSPGGVTKHIDVSAHSYWTGLVGKHICFDYVDKGHQVLRLSADINELFLSSQYDDGTFQGDCVRVSPVCELNSPFDTDAFGAGHLNR
ncbi:hypothetical protein [Noviherbaspirillum massiliense]|uniref:hypothetical protein n=1 Tax=Noviherbaspirillum massiliense TaxID=1465823 RepID=UPI0003825AF6|nr:hypothetical protein [Noviherbaspirillum massiliense]